MKDRKQEKRKARAFPTNAQRATREFVARHIGEWDQKILERRAARLGISFEAAKGVEEKPLYLIEAEREAKERNVSLENVLDEYQERLNLSNYPGPDCLLPDEVEELVFGEASPARLKHLEVCPGCSALLAASRKTEEAAEEAVKVMKAAVGSREVAPSAPFERAEREINESAREIQVFESWVALVAPPVLLLFLAGFVLFEIDHTATKATFLRSPLAWLVVGLVVLGALLGLLGFRMSSLARSIMTGGALAAFAVTLAVVDFQKTKANQALSVSLAQSQMERVCGEAFQNRQLSVAAFEPYADKGLLDLVTKHVSIDHATYEISGKGLPGRMVCQLGTSQGTINWEHGNKTDPRVLLVAGMLKTANGNTVLRAADGEKYAIPVDVITFEPATANTHVVASIDPATSSVKSVHFVAVSGSDLTLKGVLVPPDEKTKGVGPTRERPEEK